MTAGEARRRLEAAVAALEKIETEIHDRMPGHTQQDRIADTLIRWRVADAEIPAEQGHFFEGVTCSRCGMTVTG
jgi:hypothetical protein